MSKYAIGWGAEGIQYAQIFEGDETGAYNEARNNSISEVESGAYDDQIYVSQGAENGVDICYSWRKLPDDCIWTDDEDYLDELLNYLDHPDTQNDIENIIYD